MKNEPKLISSCCSAPDKSIGDTSYADFGICSSCHEHCNYEPQDEDEDEEIEKDFITNEEI